MTQVPDDCDLCYAVGDVHGHASLLSQLLDAIAAHARGAAFRLVTVGDYINKGPDSAGVLRTLIGLTATSPQVVCLMGNHDRALVDAARDEAAHETFLSMGGDRLLAQYGVGRARDLPPDVLDWMSRRPTWCSDGTRYFVHAGLDPRRSLAEQTDAIRLSMRGRFLSEDHDFGPHVVHGHTPQMSGHPTFRPYRTNIDTGVYATGILTAVAFQRGAPRPFAMLQASEASLRVASLDGSEQDV